MHARLVGVLDDAVVVRVHVEADVGDLAGRGAREAGQGDRRHLVGPRPLQGAHHVGRPPRRGDDDEHVTAPRERLQLVLEDRVVADVVRDGTEDLDVGAQADDARGETGAGAHSLDVVALEVVGDGCRAAVPAREHDPVVEVGACEHLGGALHLAEVDARHGPFQLARVLARVARAVRVATGGERDVGGVLARPRELGQHGVDGGAEVRDLADVGVRRLGGAPAEEEGAGTDGPGEPDVARAVADHPGCREVQSQRVRGGQRHAGSRLAVSARSREGRHGALRVVGAEQPQVDVCTVRGELGGHVLVHEVDVLELVHAASDAGLVRDHGDGHAGGVEPRDRA